MKHNSLKYRMAFIAFVIVLLGLANTYMAKMPSTISKTKAANLLERNFTYMEQLALYSKVYAESGNRHYLYELNATAYQITDVINTLKSGGKATFGENDVRIDEIQNAKVQAVINELSENFQYFQEHLQTLNSRPFAKDDLSLKFIANNTGDLLLQNTAARDALAVLIDKNTKQRHLLTTTVFGALGLAVAFLCFMIWKELLSPLEKIMSYAKDIARGKTTKKYKYDYQALNDLRTFLERISQNIKEASRFALQIGKGQFNSEFHLVSAKDSLGKSLVEMRDRLMKVAEEESQRNWAIKGVAKFSNILRNQQNATLQELSYEFVENLVKYTDCNQGGVFVINEDAEDDRYIELVAAYAFNKRKHLQKRIEVEEGLVGQCFLEKDAIYLEDIPNEYIQITSGLGEANPKFIFIAPVMVNEEVLGAIELASFNPFPIYYREFVGSICENFGSTISMMKMNISTQKLLEETRKVNQELQEKEEQMNQFAEELKANQEELSRDLGERTNLNNLIIDAINKTNAQVEFDVDGNILEVNNMYLSVMGFEKDELVGLNEQALLRKEDQEGYNLMWESIRSGSFHAGEYCRNGRKGNNIWINGTYNPIRNLDGEIYKIIQFGQFTTDEKERDLDLRSRINALGQSFPAIDLDIKGKVSKANPAFAKLFNYKRTELRNKQFSELIKEKIDDPLNFSQLWREVQSGDTKSEEMELVSADGSSKHCLTTFNPIRDLSGNIHKVMIVLVDNTNHKELELALIDHREHLPKDMLKAKSIDNLLHQNGGELEAIETDNI